MVEYLRNQSPGSRLLPLVLVFHEGPWQEDAANPQTMADLTGFHDAAISNSGTSVPEDDLFFTAYVGGLSTAAETQPPGSVRVGGWNTGWFSADSCLTSADDVAFAENVVTRITARLQDLFKAQTGEFGICVDSNRTCLVGWGDGGAMAYRIAAASTTFRGLAVVGATNGGRAVGGIAGNDIRYSPAPIVSNSTMVVLHLHGRTDPECVPGVFNTSQLHGGRERRVRRSLSTLEWRSPPVAAVPFRRDVQDAAVGLSRSGEPGVHAHHHESTLHRFQ